MSKERKRVRRVFVELIGYGPACEYLLAEPIGPGVARIDNIPIITDGVGYNDLVQVNKYGKIVAVLERNTRTEHATYDRTFSEKREMRKSKAIRDHFAQANIMCRPSFSGELWLAVPLHVSKQQLLKLLKDCPVRLTLKNLPKVPVVTTLEFRTQEELTRLIALASATGAQVLNFNTDPFGLPGTIQLRHEAQVDFANLARAANAGYVPIGGTRKKRTKTRTGTRRRKKKRKTLGDFHDFDQYVGKPVVIPRLKDMGGVKLFHGSCAGNAPFAGEEDRQQIVSVSTAKGQHFALLINTDDRCAFPQFWIDQTPFYYPIVSLKKVKRALTDSEADQADHTGMGDDTQEMPMPQPAPSAAPQDPAVTGE